MPEGAWRPGGVRERKSLRDLGEATTGWVYLEEPVWPGKPVRSLQPAVETSRAGDPLGKASGDEQRWRRRRGNESTSAASRGAARKWAVLCPPSGKRPHSAGTCLNQGRREVCGCRSAPPHRDPRRGCTVAAQQQYGNSEDEQQWRSPFCRGGLEEFAARPGGSWDCVAVSGAPA